MKIALDFDKTFSAHPRLWMDFIKRANSFGVSVTIVTIRDEEHDGINWKSVGLTKAPVPVIWCDGFPKKEFCRVLGQEFDVWIDDDPNGIINGSSLKDPLLLKAWREKDQHRNSKHPPSGHSKWYKAQGIPFDE
jgi:hypothetical protein